ncbi:MAG: hypothetical protein O0X49_04380, partial [Methanocorpusculum sp.]|nr:hypothetical protein [Methanocorpusculum sp.]
MKPIPAISILLLCILFLAVPAAAADDNFPEVQFAGTGESSYTDLLPADLLTKNINEMFGAKNLREIAEQHAVRFSLGKQSEVIRPVTLDDNETETPAPTDTPATTQTTPVPTPGYLTGGDRLPYPQSGSIPTVYPGNTAFVYEQIKIKIRNSDGPGSYATSIAYMTGDANPTPVNTIAADANGVINLLDVAVNGYTGAYRIYDGSIWTGSYLYIWMPELKLDAWYAGSTDSVNGQTVAKSSSITYVIDAPKVGPSGIGAAADIIITTPVGGKTTMLGTTDLSAISINSPRITTPAVPLGDPSLIGGIYQSQAEWTIPAAFANYAKKSNIISFSLGSAETLTITAEKDTVTRSNPFTVTITGNPNPPYSISIDSTGGTTVPQMIPGQIGITRGDQNPQVSINDIVKTVLIPDTAATDAKSWGVVTTASDGKRIIQYTTNPVNGNPVPEGTYTIRVNSITSYSATTAGAGTSYDTTKIRISVGGLTIATTDSGRSYYLGQEIKLTGTNTDSDTTYLFLTGPNLNPAGISLDGTGTFSKAPVSSDNTWTYTWDTGSSGLDIGTYTIYAVGSKSDKFQLAGTQYATLSIQLRQPDLSIGTTSLTAAKGDYIHIAGTASGSPAGVAIFIFGTNYYQRITTPVDNGRYDYKMYLPESMSSGQYYIIVEHPMYDGKFGIIQINSGDQTILAIPSVNGGTQSSFVVEGPNRLQGSQAANALIQMLNSPYIDDLYTTMKLTVQDPYITINPISDQETGIPFTISGTTNLAPNNQLLIEINPASFIPGDKNQQPSASGISGTTTVIAGTPNAWSYTVGGSGLPIDTYTIRVSGIAVSTSTSASLNIIASPATPPATPHPPMPLFSPAPPAPATSVPCIPVRTVRMWPVRWRLSIT